MADISDALQHTVTAAYESKTPLKITGGNSKSFYGRHCQGDEIQLAGHSGIVKYEPSELIIRARAGTPLSDIETLLADHNQMLGFEPPEFDGGATLGGVVASGLSGPRRPFAGSVRDFVLGCKLLNGRGEMLSFGGEVMKNVAGYDVSRLMAGSLGTLGVILEVSLKVLPKPAFEITLAIDVKPDDVIELMTEWCATSLIMTALSYDGERVYARLSGNESIVLSHANKMGGERVSESAKYWSDVGNQRHPFFQSEKNIWRLSLSPASPFPDLSGNWFTDWGGAQRWLKSDEHFDAVFSCATECNGHAQLFRSNEDDVERFHPLPKNMWGLHQKIKKAFDPAGIFNRGKMYKTL